MNIHYERKHPRLESRTRSVATALRNTQTKPEWIIWLMLRGQKMGVKFRRQQPIGPYIVDFYCASLKLVIEADGGHHTEQLDAQRNQYLHDHGLAILRFWNSDILTNENGVYLTILEAIKKLQNETESSPPPSR